MAMMDWQTLVLKSVFVFVTVQMNL
jgi:hypothetical protein